jgi:hypothetical protein
MCVELFHISSINSYTDTHTHTIDTASAVVSLHARVEWFYAAPTVLYRGCITQSVVSWLYHTKCWIVAVSHEVLYRGCITQSVESWLYHMECWIVAVSHGVLYRGLSHGVLYRGCITRSVVSWLYHTKCCVVAVSRFIRRFSKYCDLYFIYVFYLNYMCNLCCNLVQFVNWGLNNLNIFLLNFYCGQVTAT